MRRRNQFDLILMEEAKQKMILNVDSDNWAYGNMS